MKQSLTELRRKIMTVIFENFNIPLNSQTGSKQQQKNSVKT